MSHEAKIESQFSYISIFDKDDDFKLSKLIN